jgi:hypothetical protein
MFTRILIGVAGATLLSFAVHAQQAANPSRADYQTPEGSLTVHSGQPGPRTYAAAPPFAQLAGGKGYITQSDAQGYDLLANDFIHADGNRDGRITQAEYDRWVHGN